MGTVVLRLIEREYESGPEVEPIITKGDWWTKWDSRSKVTEVEERQDEPVRPIGQPQKMECEESEDRRRHDFPEVHESAEQDCKETGYKSKD